MPVCELIKRAITNRGLLTLYFTLLLSEPRNSHSTCTRSIKSETLEGGRTCDEDRGNSVPGEPLAQPATALDIPIRVCLAEAVAW